MQTEVKNNKRKLVLSTKRKASEDINADCTKRSALEPRSYLFQAFLDPRQRLYACLVAKPQQATKHSQWPQSKYLSLPTLDNSGVSNCVERKWTALPRPNIKHLTRQPVLKGTQSNLFREVARDDTPPQSPLGNKSPDEEDPFAKYDELCASVDLTVYLSSSSEEQSPVISSGSVACGNGSPLGPSPMSDMAPNPCTHDGALCPVCGHLLVSKASLAEHMKTCIDVIVLD